MVDNAIQSPILDGLNSLKGAVVSLGGGITGLKGAVASLSGEITGLKVDLAGVKSDVADLKVDVAVITGEVVNINEKLDRHEVLLSHLAGLPREVFDIKQEIAYIKEDTAKIPTLQRQLDITATANALDRQERTFMKNRVDGHEERLTVVENTLSIKSPAEVF